MQKNKHKQLAFTLVELLVVIAIIGLLASIVLVASNRSRMLGRDAKRKADLKQYATAFSLFISTNGYSVGEGSGVSWGVLTNTCPASSVISELVPAYMSAVLDDPLSPGPPGCGSIDGYYYYYGRKYIITSSGLSTANATTANFVLCSKLENTSDPGYKIYANPANASWTLNYCIGG